MNEFEKNYNNDLVKSYLTKIFTGIYENKNNKTFKDMLGISSIDLEKFDTYRNEFYYSGIITVKDIEYAINTDYGISITSIGKISVPSIYEKNIENSTYTLTGDNVIDALAIKNLIKEFSKFDSKDFQTNDYRQYPLDVSHHGPICNDVPFALFLIDSIGFSHGFIDKEEHAYLSDIFHLGQMGVRDKIVDNDMFKCFDSSFKLLKAHDFNPDNVFTYNDLDNHIAYLERDNYQAITYESQNHFFIVVKELSTNRMKAWAAMYYTSENDDDFVEELSWNFEKENEFNVIDYMIHHCNEEFSPTYRYPFDFEHSSYRRHFNFYFNNFDFSGNDCVYDSKYGFQTSFRLRNSLVFEVRCGNDNLLDELEVSDNIVD